MNSEARAMLEQQAAGNPKRPRGNAVLATEYASVAPFAKACGQLVRTTLYGGDRADPFEDSVEVTPESFAAPSEALPPLP